MSECSGQQFPSSLWARQLPRGRRNPGSEGFRPQMVSGCFFPSSFFSADQFVVSVPTKVSGGFESTFFFPGEQCGGWWRVLKEVGSLGEGQATVPKYFKPHKVLNFPRALRPATLALPRGLWGHRGPDRTVSSESLRQSQMPPQLVLTPLPSAAQVPPPGGPPRDQPLPRSPGTKK